MWVIAISVRLHPPCCNAIGSVLVNQIYSVNMLMFSRYTFLCFNLKDQRVIKMVRIHPECCIQIVGKTSLNAMVLMVSRGPQRSRGIMTLSPCRKHFQSENQTETSFNRSFFPLQPRPVIPPRPVCPALWRSASREKVSYPCWDVWNIGGVQTKKDWRSPPPDVCLPLSRAWLPIWVTQQQTKADQSLSAAVGFDGAPPLHEALIWAVYDDSFSFSKW